MGRKARLLLSSLPLLTLTLACGWFGARVDSGALSRYTQTLPLNGLALERCAMHRSSRKGYCILRGQPAESDGFVRDLPLAPAATEPTYGESCWKIPGFGRADPEAESATVILPDGAYYRPNGELPPNQDNVHLRAVTIDPAGTGVCIDYEFPYG